MNEIFCPSFCIKKLKMPIVITGFSKKEIDESIRGIIGYAYGDEQKHFFEYSFRSEEDFMNQLDNSGHAFTYLWKLDCHIQQVKVNEYKQHLLEEYMDGRTAEETFEDCSWNKYFD